MQVATCTITLQLYGVDSLKAKRRIVKPIVTRLPRHFNVATAEVDCHDVWGTAVICLATVGNDSGHLHATLEKAVAWIERDRPDAVVEQYAIQII